MPNLVAATRFARPGRHLVLNGHIDVFPSGDPARWTHDPLSRRDRRRARARARHRGHEMRHHRIDLHFLLPERLARSSCAGALTLTLVSDEETGGRWGSGYLVEHHADEVLGDCVLNGEPSSPHTIRFGEKAMFWMKFSIRTPGGHSAYPHVSKSANRIAAALIRDLESLESLVPAAPEKVARALGGTRRSRRRRARPGRGRRGVPPEGDAQRRGHARRGQGQHAARLVRDRGGRPSARGRRPRRRPARGRADRRPVPGSEPGKRGRASG